MNKKVSIILTTYNEAREIKETINKINEFIPKAEIILVDDNSTDGTIEEAKSTNNPNLVCYSRKRRGLASAFLVGLINSSGDIVGWVDSNMSNIIKNYPKMISKLDEADIVILSRYIEGSIDERNKFRVIVSHLLNKFSKIILRSKINDISSGLHVMKREVFLSEIPIAFGHGEFFMEFLARLEKKGHKIIELPYTHSVDIEGNSKSFPNLYTFSKLGFFYILRLLRTIFKRQ
jgi:glycosyltransferase involved in cell wall biosynthesis